MSRLGFSFYVFPAMVLLAFGDSADAGQVNCGISQSCVTVASNFSPKPRVAALRPITRISQKLKLSACLEGTLTMNIDKTISDCEFLLKVNEGSVRDRAGIMFMLGHAYMRTKNGLDGLSTGSGNRSMEMWQQAIELDPTYVEPLLAIGRIYGMSDQTTKAFKYLAKAEKLAPTYWRVFTYRSEVFRYMLNASAALREAEKALQLNPTESAVRRAYAIALEHNFRDVEAAEQYLIAAETYDPQKDKSLEFMRDQDAWVSLAFIYAKLDRPAMAAAAITKCIDSKKEHGPDFMMLKQRSAYYEQANMFDRAVEDIELALERAPEYERENLNSKRVALLAKSGAKEDLGTDLNRMLETGSLKARLKVQVFLKNQGYAGVTINGTYDEATKRAFDACMQDKKCAPGVEKAI